MEESFQVITHLRAEVTSLRQRVTSLTVQVQTQEAVLNALQDSLRFRETEMANQRTTMAELQSALEEHAVLASELRQELAEQDVVQQALEVERQQYQAWRGWMISCKIIFFWCASRSLSGHPTISGRLSRRG